MPEEPWTEVDNIVQEAVDKAIPKKKKCKKAKWLSEEALQITEKKRSKRQGRKGKTQPTECRVQRKARREKAFLNEKCKEIEKNNRTEKTRDLFKKIGDTMGTFHAKTGMMRDRNSKGLTEAEEIQEEGARTQRTVQKGLNDWVNHDGVITHLQPDIMECEVGLRKHHYKQSQWR